MEPAKESAAQILRFQRCPAPLQQKVAEDAPPMEDGDAGTAEARHGLYQARHHEFKIRTEMKSLA